MNVPQMAPIWVALAAALNRIAVRQGITWNPDKVTSVCPPSTLPPELEGLAVRSEDLCCLLYGRSLNGLSTLPGFLVGAAAALGKERRSKLIQAVFERAGSVKVMFTNGRRLPLAQAQGMSWEVIALIGE